MQKLVSVLAGLFFSIISMSQVRFGIKAGVNFSGLSNAYQTASWQTQQVSNPDAKSRAGFSGGIFTDIRISNELFARPSLISLNPAFTTPDRYDLLGNIYMGARKYVLHYINLPVQVIYSPELKFGRLWVGTGPYGGMLVGGNYKTSGAKLKLNLGKEPTDDFKNFDFGLSSCAGVMLNNGIFLDIGYNMGLSDVTPGQWNSKNSGWTLCLGFGIK